MKIDKLTIYFTLYFASFFTFEGYSQNHFLFEEDSSKIAVKNVELGNMSTYIKTFNLNLNNGTWYYCPFVKRQDTNKCKESYLSKVTFKNGLKQGTLEIQSRFKKKYFPYIYVSYNNDTLHGPFSIFGGAGKKFSEGYYKNGKKHGLFFKYYHLGIDYNSIEWVGYYENDTLLYWQCYGHYQKLRWKCNCIDPEVECVCSLHDTIGTLLFNCFFNDEMEIYKIKYFDFYGNITQVIEEDFEFAHFYRFSNHSSLRRADGSIYLLLTDKRYNQTLECPNCWKDK